MKKQYEYLSDSAFLRLFALQRKQEQFLKITLLNWNEEPIQEIQGLVQSGSCSVSDSALRRTCNFEIFIDEKDYLGVTDLDNLISLNKKFCLEIGFTNRTSYYSQYEKIWFPLGIYIITNPSVSYSTDGVNISIEGEDKMCLLNGDIGGIIPASTQFDEYETVDKNGEYYITYPLITQIITEAVNHFGGEQLGKIIISDVDSRIKKVMKWIGSNPLYMLQNGNTYSLTTNSSVAETSTIAKTFSYGDDIGYIYTDLIYGSELIGDAGSNVTDILDKIVSYLGGNYEYFYDVFGNFIFQEKKNYLNTTQATEELDNMNTKGYFVDMTKGKSVFDFDDSTLVTSYSSSPQYNMIKNDFVVWGIRENSNGNSVSIRYHLAIDNKPEIGNTYKCFIFIDEDGLNKAKVPIYFKSRKDFPQRGVEESYYLDKSTGTIYKWDSLNSIYVAISGASVYEYAAKENFPTLGESSIFYLDLSTNKKYVWALDSSSEHYQTIAEEISTVKNTYTNNILDIDEDIKKLKTENTNYESEIEILKTANETAQTTIDNNEITIDNLDKDYAEQQEKIDEWKSGISLLETQQENAKNTYGEDSVQYMNYGYEIDKLEEYIDEAEEVQKTDTNEKTALTTENTTLQTTIDTNTKSINTKQEAINANLKKIAEFEAKKKSLQTEYISDLDTLETEQYEYILADDITLKDITTKDWRQELYLQGATGEPLGIDSNYYYTELNSEWPKVYDVENGNFFSEVLEKPWDIDFYLDFIDSEAKVSQFSVSNIGRRSIVVTDNDVNCIFEPEIPDFVLIEKGQTDTEKKRQECESQGQDYIQIDSAIYNLITGGGSHNSAYNKVRELLYQYTAYNDSINISAIPLYHLEPNTRITVNDKRSKIQGDYVINSISIPLDPGGTMSISATKALDRV